LPITNINGNNLLRTLAKEDICEASSGRACIKTYLACDNYIGKDFECTGQFVAASRDEVITLASENY
jgi:hypothetical protein